MEFEDFIKSCFFLIHFVDLDDSMKIFCANECTCRFSLFCFVIFRFLFLFVERFSEFAFSRRRRSEDGKAKEGWGSER